MSARTETLQERIRAMVLSGTITREALIGALPNVYPDAIDKVRQVLRARGELPVPGRHHRQLPNPSMLARKYRPRPGTRVMTPEMEYYVACVMWVRANLPTDKEIAALTGCTIPQIKRFRSMVSRISEHTP